MNNLIEIEKTSLYIQYYCLKRFKEKLDYFELFIELLEHIAYSMCKWSGNTYVGIRKKENEQNVYQNFFKNVYFLIDTLEKNSEKNINLETEFLRSIKYNGKIYRYLGYGNPIDKNINKKIIPEYADIYVSWSKNETNFYIESKLYGKITKLYGNIEKPNYGLDLEGFQKFLNNCLESKFYISKGEEKEVVFSTIKECIYDIKYLK